MIKVEQLHNVMMDYNGDVLWIKYCDNNGLTITSLNNQETLTGDVELDVLRFIIKTLSMIDTADSTDTDNTDRWLHK
jgi:hypothetical protein